MAKTMQKIAFSTIIANNEPIKIEMAEPVCIRKDSNTGKESIYYNSRLMEKGKLYPIKWEEEIWA